MWSPAVDGRVRVQGSASGLRRVFYARPEGVVLASDRADVLADLLHSSLDPAAVALRLLPGIPHPLGNRPVWRDVEQVPPAGTC